MANNLGELTILLRAELAQLRSDLGKANQLAQQSAKEMSKAMREQAERAKDSIDVLGDAIGVRLPRELKGVLAECQTFGRLAAAVFTPIAVIGFANVFIENVVPAIKSAAQWMGGYTAEVRAAEEAQIRFNKVAADTALKIAALKEETARMGLTPLQLAGRDKAQADTTVSSLQAQMAAYQAQDHKIREDRYALRISAEQYKKDLADVQQKIAQTKVALDLATATQEKYAKAFDLASADDKKKRIEAQTKAIKDQRKEIEKLETILSKSYGAQNWLSADQRYGRSDLFTATVSQPLPLPFSSRGNLFEASVLPPAAKSSLSQFADQMLTIQGLTDSLDKSFENWALDMTINSKGIAQSFASMAMSIVSSIEGMIAKMFALWAVQQLVGFMFPRVSSNVVSSLPLSKANSLFTATIAPPLHDYPGLALPNTPYRVGTPEVILPTGGMAIPLSRFDGGNSKPTYFIDARGSNDPAAVEIAVARAISKYAPTSVRASLVASQQYAFRH